MIGAVEGEVAKRFELRLDAIEPRAVMRGIGGLDVVVCGPVADFIAEVGLKLSRMKCSLVSGG
jgi:hypothetical protein